LAAANYQHKLLVVSGSIIMILGALAISTAVASSKEQTSTNEAVLRECERYGLDYNRTIMALAGDEFGARNEKRRWWDYAIIAAATSVFIWLGVRAVVPPLAMSGRWIAVLGGVLLLSLIAGTWSLWKRTRFS
ncbi:MAG: EamA/RhaT family transporter, partial [Edaphobacter sp.]